MPDNPETPEPDTEDTPQISGLETFLDALKIFTLTTENTPTPDQDAEANSLRRREWCVATLMAAALMAKRNGKNKADFLISAEIAWDSGRLFETLLEAPPDLLEHALANLS